MLSHLHLPRSMFQQGNCGASQGVRQAIRSILTRGTELAAHQGYSNSLIQLGQVKESGGLAYLTLWRMHSEQRGS
jgi:hypothetical protein